MGFYKTFDEEDLKDLAFNLGVTGGFDTYPSDQYKSDRYKALLKDRRDRRTETDE